MTNKIKPKTDRILLAHGSGGRLTHELIRTVFMPRFSNAELDTMDDAALITAPGMTAKKLAFTTDSFVVNPLFFAGGDIGKLAVYGTVNDLAMKGARPLALSVAAIIEEGLDMATLEKVAASLALAARTAGVNVVTGDTKVVEKGKADKLFITTSAVGAVYPGANVSGANARHGDAVLINGFVGDHGIAVMAARNEFKFSGAISSDCAPLNGLVEKLLSRKHPLHVLRDPTRGGVATTLNEIAAVSGVGIILDEASIPVSRPVRAACNILGLDPLYVANEGKALVIAPASSSAAILSAMRSHRHGKNAASIGTVVKSPKGVWLKTTSGGLRPLAMLEGEQLPRIC